MAIARRLGESICDYRFHRYPVQPQPALLGCSSIANVSSDLGAAQQAPLCLRAISAQEKPIDVERVSPGSLA